MAKRGRKPGKTGARKGSIHYRLGQLEVGDHFWMEITVKQIQSAMTSATKPDDRRPLDTIGKKFSAHVVRAVGAIANPETDVVLVKYTRTE